MKIIKIYFMFFGIISFTYLIILGLTYGFDAKIIINK